MADTVAALEGRHKADLQEAVSSAVSRAVKDAESAAFSKGRAAGREEGDRGAAGTIAALTDSHASELAAALAKAEERHKLALKHVENGRAYDRLQYQEEYVCARVCMCVLVCCLI